MTLSREYARPLSSRRLVVGVLVAASVIAGPAFRTASGVAGASQVPVVPGAEGFGTTTVAGRGGAILRVTTLKDGGPGSLRAALLTPGPRTIIFETSGTIVINRDLEIRSSYVTVAGQTAPSPGITIRGAGLDIQTHDVLVQHLRIRVGDEVGGPPPGNFGNRQGLKIENVKGGVFNVVADHLSVSWPLGKSSTWYPLHDVTISHCIFSEGLLSPQYPYSMGLLLGDSGTNVSVIGSLFAHNDERNPYVKGATTAIFANNLIYDPGHFAVMLSDYNHTGPFAVTIVGNVMIPGPSTVKPHIVQALTQVPRGSRVYMADNLAPAQLYQSPGIVDPTVGTAPVWTTPLTVRPAGQVEAWVLATAGARPADRDAVDQRLITEVRTRTGRIITSQTDVGGWPDLVVNVRPLTLPANPNGDSGNGYTNLEMWLEQFAAQVEGRSP